MEGYLPAAHALGWTVAAAPFLVHSTAAVRRATGGTAGGRMRLAASGAFVLLLTSLKLPSVAGSSSHPTGTGLGAVLVGAPVMPVVALLVLLFQALLLAHGGLTTLGANVVSLGVVGPWIAVGTHRALRRAGLGELLAVGMAAAAADLATYGTTALQLALAFPQEEGGIGASLAKFLTVFGVTQLPLAVVEGVFAALVWRAVAARRAPLTRRGLA